MNNQKILQLIIGPIVAVLMLIGCSAPEATATSFSAPIGEVEPIPEGCIYMAFVSPSDHSAYERDQSGRISAVITPTGRIEPLQKQWTMKDFEEVIYNPGERDLTSRYLPGVVAWEYLKVYLQSEDEIWTFGVLDTGFVIIREDKVFSIVVTDHSL